MMMWVAVSLIGFLYLSEMATLLVAALMLESEAAEKVRTPTVVALCIVWPFLMVGILVGAIVAALNKESGE